MEQPLYSERDLQGMKAHIDYLEAKLEAKNFDLQREQETLLKQILDLQTLLDDPPLNNDLKNSSSFSERPLPSTSASSTSDSIESQLYKKNLEVVQLRERIEVLERQNQSLFKDFHQELSFIQQSSSVRESSSFLEVSEIKDQERQIELLQSERLHLLEMNQVL